MNLDVSFGASGSEILIKLRARPANTRQFRGQMALLLVGGMVL
jgi:hypothetical protein